MAPPSMPLRVIMASPRTVCAPIVSATPLSGWPSKRSRNTSDHATVKPELAGRSFETATPLDARIGAQPRPACAAEREDCGLGRDGLHAVGCLKPKPSLVVPAGPAMTKRETHAG